MTVGRFDPAATYRVFYVELDEPVKDGSSREWTPALRQIVGRIREHLDGGITVLPDGEKPETYFPPGKVHKVVRFIKSERLP